MIHLNSRNWDYHLFNFLIFTFIIFMMLLVKTEAISVKCVYAEIGDQCKTCGLTTSFRQLLNGNLKGLPLGHILLFVLFSSQLIIRPLISWLIKFFYSNRMILIVDIILSLIVLIWTMKELLWE